MKKKVFVLLATMMLVIGLHGGQVIAEEDTIAATDEVWFSSALLAPPYEPVHECWTFTFDGASWTLQTEGFGEGPAWVRPGSLNAFGATLEPGILNQGVLGWFLNGTDFGWSGNVIGGVMARPPKVWGFEGVRNDDCQ